MINDLYKEVKAYVFDIETTDFNADFGEVLSIAYRRLGYKTTKSFDITQTKEFKKDFTDDRGVLAHIQEVFDDADVLIGHYSKRFDFPFIQSRLLLNDMELLNPQVKQVCTWEAARSSLKFTSNRLANLSTQLCNTPKDKVARRDWRLAKGGDVAAIKKIAAYNIVDVDATTELFDKLQNITKTPMIDINIIRGYRGDVCPHCGSHNKRNKGRNTKLTLQYYQWKCNDCNRSFTGRTRIKPIEL